MPKTLTPYYGGKYNKVGEFITSILPEHRHYIELCGGMAGILMMKKPSFQEVYNDVDEHLVNLFRVVRDPAGFEKLKALLELTPYARDEWKFCQRRFRKEKDPVEKARQTYVTLSQGFAGSLGNKSFSYGGLKYESSVARTYFNGLWELEAIHQRITNVLIENQQALEVAQKWDGKDSLLYFDPPYLKETRKTYNDYSYEMTKQEHVRVLEFLTQCKSKVIVSGYRTQLYDQILIGSGFIRVEIPIKSSLSLSNSKNHSPFRTECVWLNYKPHQMVNPLLFPTNYHQDLAPTTI